MILHAARLAGEGEQLLHRLEKRVGPGDGTLGGVHERVGGVLKKTLDM